MILIDLIFVPIYLALLSLQWRVRAPFFRTHAVFFALFFPLLHVARSLTGSSDYTYSAYGNAIAHLIAVSYMAIFWIGSAAIASNSPSVRDVSSVLVRVTPGHVGLAISFWLSLKTYLAFKYGASAFLVLGTVAGDERLRFLDPLDAAIASYAGYLAVGATIAYVIRLVTKSLKWQHPMSVLVVIFLIGYVITGETSVGARRFILLLVILAMSVAIGIAMENAVHRRTRARIVGIVIIGVVVAGGFNVYYQAIRDNFFTEKNAERILSGDPVIMLSALVDSLVPSQEVDSEMEERPLLRQGPFDAIAGISDHLIENGQTTKGNIVLRSAEMLVPRILTGGQKETFNLDLFVSDTFEVVPEGTYAEIDLAMSPLAIVIADFGFLGIPLAPLLMVLMIGFYAYVLRRLGSISPVYAVITLGALYQTIGIVENDLVAIMASVREFIALIVLASAIRALLALVRVLYRASVATNERRLPRIC